MTDELPRRLLAVMFTDIKGFSALMSADEARTVRLVEEHRAVVRDVLARHRGHEHETIGDAFVILFEAATDAVACALDVQARFRARDAATEPRDRIYVRIGIHLDEVITRDGNIYGRGVNVAARIEPLARPGGICVTESVWSTVSGRIDIRAVPMGVVDLKHIPNPPPLFQLDVPGALAAPAPPRPRRWRRRRVAFAAAALAVCVLTWVATRPESDSPCEDPRAMRQYDEGIALLLAAEPAAAERRLAAARDIEPEEPLVWLIWGVAATVAQESSAVFAHAVSEAADVATAHPDEEGADLAHLVAAQVADTAGTEASVATARAWLRDHPGDRVAAAALLLAALMRVSASSSALAEDVVAAFPEDALLWALAGDVVEVTDLVRARDDWARAVELAPGAALSHAGLGGANYALGALAEARRDLRRSLEINGNQARARNFLARACMRLGDDECIASQIEWAHSPHVDPGKSRDLLAYLGQLFLQAGRPKAAEPLLEKSWRMATEQSDRESEFWPLIFLMRSWELGIAEGSPTVDARLAETIGSPDLPALKRVRYDESVLLARAGRALVAGDLSEADRLLQRLEALPPDQVGAPESARLRALRIRVWVAQGRIEEAAAVPPSESDLMPVPRTPVLLAQGDRAAALAEVQGFLENETLRLTRGALIAGHALDIAESALAAGDRETADAARVVFHDVWPAPEDDVPYVQRMNRVEAALAEGAVELAGEGYQR